MLCYILCYFRYEAHVQQVHFVNPSGKILIMKNVYVARFVFGVLVFMGCNVGAQTTISNFGTNPGTINAYQYVPAGMPANAPLVIVLHGCTQTMSSYSTETQWNNLADRHKFYVAYGEQTSTNNSTECFNYFLTGDNSRGQGEALSIKQITDYMKSNHSIDSTRVFVTGLSAGGAMTAVMCSTYPDVFSAGAEMSGLPYGCATSALTADYACLGQVTKTPQQWGDLARAQNPGYTGNWPRMAIFQGTSDAVVSPVNSTEMIKQFTNLHGIDQTADYTKTAFNGNALITLDQFFDSANRVQVEHYTIANMAHGTAIDPGSCYQQGGATGSQNLAFDENFYSPFWAAQFFGILQMPYSITGLSSVTISQQGLTYSVPNTAGSTYTWIVPAGATIVSGQGTNSITVNWGTASGTIYVTEMPTGGCEQGPVTLYVRATGQPALVNDAGINNLTAPANQICTTSLAPQFTLTNNGTDTLTSATINYSLNPPAMLNYGWTGTLLPGQSTVVTLPNLNTTAGTHIIEIIVSQPNGSTDANLINDTIRTGFTAGITPVVSLGHDTTQCGGSVTLTTHITGDQFAWSNGASSPAITVTQSNTYTVTVSSNGCSSTSSVNVTINPVPVIALTGGNVCAAQLVLDAGNAGSTYSWSNNATTQTITATSTGSYSVTVTSALLCSASASVQVNVSSAPAINLGLGGMVCGTNIILDAGNPGDTFLWSTGATTETITSSTSGPYSVTVTGGVNCSSSAAVNITLNPVPVVNLGAGGAHCGTSFGLDAGNAGDTYYWSTGETTEMISITFTGTYNVTVTNSSACTASGTVNVQLNPYPVITFQLSPDSICAGTGLYIIDTVQPPGGTFLGEYMAGDTFDNVHAPAGVYPIAYGYTDGNGCFASGTQNLVVSVCTGIENVNADMMLKVFPNPNATGVLFLETDRWLPACKLKLFDALGSLVREQFVTGQNMQVDITALSAGVYVVCLEGDGLSVRRKVVVE